MLYQGHARVTGPLASLPHVWLEPCWGQNGPVLARLGADPPKRFRENIGDWSRASFAHR